MSDLRAGPWNRSLLIQRLGAVAERYRAMLAPAPPDAELLRAHPAFLIERRCSSDDEIAQRLGATEAELRELKSAAPLPPPDPRIDRRSALARSDLLSAIGGLATVVRAFGRMRQDRLLGGIFEEAVAIVVARHRLAAPEVRALIGVRAELKPSAITRATSKPSAPPPALESNAVSSWVWVGSAADVPEGRGLRVYAFEEAVAIFRQGDRLFAIGADCPHRIGPLEQGWLKGGAAVCPHHGWCFDLETGVRVGDPSWSVPVYEVDVRAGDLWIRRRAAPSSARIVQLASKAR